MAAPVIQLKRGLLANLPGLQAGEPGFTTDSYDLYVGLTSETATNKIIGSHRFWTNNTTTTGSGVNLVEGTNNGSHFITIKAPNSLAGIVTYTMPGTDGTNGQALVTNGSGTLSFATVTTSAGTLTGAGVGITDFLVTPSSANLAAAVTDETGTGALVFANTPTLVTPVLGTPTSGTLTNCTGLPVSTGISGLGVNVATFLATPSSANLASALTDETGSSTVVFSASPTFTGTAAFASATATSVVVGSAVTITASGVHASTGIVTAFSFRPTSGYYQSANGTNAFYVYDTSGNVSFQGTIGASAINGGAGNRVVNLLGADASFVGNVRIAGITTVGSGIGITQFSSAVGSGTSISSVPTSSAVIDYVAAQIAATDTDDDLGIAGDTGTGTINLDSQSLTVAGTANEIETSASGQTITVGLPSAVQITTSLDVPTVEATNLKAKDGTNAITITDGTGAVAMANNLTVSGNLYVNGSTTQVNTTTTTIEDQLLDLGMVDGSAPSSDLNKDIGVLFNYYTSSAKKAALFWDDSVSRVVAASDVTESTGVLTINTYADFEAKSLYINGCTGQSEQVIACSGSKVVIQNVTIDGGTF